MERSKFVTAIAIAGSVCSITGISLLGIVGSTPGGTPIPGFLLIVTGAILVSLLIAVWVLRGKLIGAMELRDGRIVSASALSQVSRNFANGSLRTLRIFAGDLSWLETDLTAYRDLVRRGVTVKILTDSPSASAISVGKPLGIEFREYPDSVEAPLKASISDAEEESESRALVVKRRTFRPGSRQEGEYCYWMKEYHGSIEYAAIRAMMLLFDDKFAAGKPL